MKLIAKAFSYLKPFVPLVFFGALFSLSIFPLRDFDIWFHLKSGEVIVQKGIIHYDVFSYVTKGREWFPYEWLFQITVYYIKTWFGFESLKYFTAMGTTLTTIVLYNILKKIFSISLLYNLFICFFFFASTVEFYSARPHVFAYLFFITTLFLIYLFFFKNKNFLLLSLPITFFWANIHGSIFLDIFLFGGYSLLAYFLYLKKKDKSWLMKGHILAVFTGITAILTVMPPLWLTQYRLLIYFSQHSQTLNSYISEWTPLYTEGIVFWIYTSVLTSTIAITVWICMKQRRWMEALPVISLLPITFAAYIANRNLYLGYIVIAVVLGWAFKYIKLRAVVVIALIAVTIGCGWLYDQKNQYVNSTRLYYPVHAKDFIIEHLKGNMFNEYGYGGYLLYYLYPKQKVFVDGRSDLFLCCEIPNLLSLAKIKTLSSSQSTQFLNSEWSRYNISFVLIRTEKNTILRKIGILLEDDPNWSLVFWDDYSMIYVRKDGKNDDVIKQFGTSAATPYNKLPYRTGKEREAYNEYLKMIKVTDSAKSRNAVGFLLLKKGKLDQAKTEFEKALALDPTFESPFMNLAELAAHDNNIDMAISYYQRAEVLAPDRGLIYIRLGQLLYQRNGDLESAKQIWSVGLKETADADAKKQLQQLLNQQ